MEVWKQGVTYKYFDVCFILPLWRETCRRKEVDNEVEEWCYIALALSFNIVLLKEAVSFQYCSVGALYVHLVYVSSFQKLRSVRYNCLAHLSLLFESFWNVCNQSSIICVQLITFERSLEAFAFSSLAICAFGFSWVVLERLTKLMCSGK